MYVLIGDKTPGVRPSAPSLLLVADAMYLAALGWSNSIVRMTRPWWRASAIGASGYCWSAGSPGDRGGLGCLKLSSPEAALPSAE
jgi:hypothetical protein